MSAAPARPIRPAVRPSSAPQPRRRDHLRPVAAPEQSRSLLPFAMLCVGIILFALAAVLLLNTTMARGAYDARDMRMEVADLHQERARLITELEANAAPQELSGAASELGMVPAEKMGFISLEGDQVLKSGGR